MASNFKKSETILIPFRDGWSISDSQGKPRMYKTIKAFEKSFPKHYLGTDGVELVEYAEVRHGRWIKDRYQYCNYDFTIETRECIRCSECKKLFEKYSKTNYCPNCGAKMDLEV